MHPAYKPVRKLYFYKLIRLTGGLKALVFNLRIYRKWRHHATCQQIVFKRGNLKLLMHLSMLTPGAEGGGGRARGGDFDIF